MGEVDGFRHFRSEIGNGRKQRKCKFKAKLETGRLPNGKGARKGTIRECLPRQGEEVRIHCCDEGIIQKSNSRRESAAPSAPRGGDSVAHQAQEHLPPLRLLSRRKARFHHPRILQKRKSVRQAQGRDSDDVESGG